MKCARTALLCAAVTIAGFVRAAPPERSPATCAGSICAFVLARQFPLASSAHSDIPPRTSHLTITLEDGIHLAMHAVVIPASRSVGTYHWQPDGLTATSTVYVSGPGSRAQRVGLAVAAPSRALLDEFLATASVCVWALDATAVSVDGKQYLPLGPTVCVER
jgi:hypothetical protein